MDDNQIDGARLIPERPELRAGELALDTAQVRDGRTASMLPLVVLYQRAWDLAQAAEVSFAGLVHSAEAAALADAVRHLLDDVGDREGSIRWSVRFSEARHLTRIIHDGSSRNCRVTWRDRRAEPGGSDAYSCSTVRIRGASPPAEGPSQQRIGDCSRSTHE